MCSGGEIFSQKCVGETEARGQTFADRCWPQHWVKAAAEDEKPILVYDQFHKQNAIPPRIMITLISATEGRLKKANGHIVVVVAVGGGVDYGPGCCTVPQMPGYPPPLQTAGS